MFNSDIPFLLISAIVVSAALANNVIQALPTTSHIGHIEGATTETIQIYADACGNIVAGKLIHCQELHGSTNK